MSRLLRFLLRRFRPRVGWLPVLIALGAAGCPALAAGSSSLDLPEGLIFWAGLLGVFFGLRLARPGDEGRKTNDEGSGTQLLSFFALHPSSEPTTIFRKTALARARRIIYGLAFVGTGALLIVAGGNALPPAALLWQDVAEGVARLEAWWSGMAIETPLDLVSWRFAQIALPRFWNALVAAPGAGAAGATLLLSVGSVAATWIGASVLGWAVGGWRLSLGWTMPLLFALAATTILSGADGAGLVIGIGLLLALTIIVGYMRREQSWERSGTAYSDELRWSIYGWGSGLAAAIIILALAIPTTIPDALARLIWPQVELPSGLAAIEQQVQRGPSRAPRVDPGISRLPAVPLGVSLAQDVPETLALRVRLETPLPPGAWPRYWRVRVLNRYTGRAWTSDARTGPFDAPAGAEPAPTGLIGQQIEDLRQSALALAALPNAVGVDIRVVAERLSDGSLAALTSDQSPQRYRVLSQPQELAAPPSPAGPQPDLSVSLALPGSVTARVRELARAIVGSRTRPYEQALALEDYLRSLPYTYEVRPLPAAGDAVDQFLFEMRHGYCTYYASAMVVMARSLGIPARMATGYVSGEYDDATGVYTVREADAHAWPELYLDGRWLPFEPTPIRPLPARGDRSTATPVPVLPVEPESGPLPPGRLWPAIATVLLLAFVAGVWLMLRRQLVGPVANFQARLERQGRRVGVPWPVGASLQEYGRLLEARRGNSCAALGEAIGLVERAHYGGRPLSVAEEWRLREAGAQVWGWLRK